MSKVTVITAVKNGEMFFAETINSIINQTFKDWEYIIVDDNSNDKTVEIVEDFIKDDERIKLIKLNKTKGPFGAANIGIKHALGKYIIRTDADDLSLPERIKSQVDFLDKNNFRACATFGKLIDKHSNETGYKFKYPTDPDVIKWYLCLQCPIIHSSLCIEKNALIEIGGYRELPASQDYRLFTDISRKAWFSILDKELVLFRNHSLRLSNSIVNKKQFQFAKEIIINHFFKLTGEKLTDEDAGNLYRFGLSGKSSILDTAKIANKWIKYVKNDKITINYTNELESIFYEKMRSFLKKNAFNEPFWFVYHYIKYLR